MTLFHVTVATTTYETYMVDSPDVTDVDDAILRVKNFINGTDQRPMPSFADGDNADSEVIDSRVIA